MCWQEPTRNFNVSEEKMESPLIMVSIWASNIKLDTRIVVLHLLKLNLIIEYETAMLHMCKI